MKKAPAVFALLVAVFVVAALASLLSINLSARLQRPAQGDAHDWIHSQLGLTAEQMKSLEPIEQRYHEQRRMLEAQMHVGNMELAEAILADGKDSQRVQEAIHKIHLSMGELQSATIGHVFAMKPVLTPEQYDKLLHFTADALGKIDTEHGEE